MRDPLFKLFDDLWVCFCVLAFAALMWWQDVEGTQLLVHGAAFALGYSGVSLVRYYDGAKA